MRQTFILTFITILFSLTGGCDELREPKDKRTRLLLVTDLGTIRIVLFDETNLHRENIKRLAKEGYYDSQLFHRLIKDFMIQGGDPNSKNAEKGELLGKGGSGYTIPAEINPKYYHRKGALAAARNNDDINPSKASSGSQFYIVQGTVLTKSELEMMVQYNVHSPFTAEEIAVYTTVGGSPHLDGKYTVFGQVESGFDVLDKLMNTPVDSNNRPLTDIRFRIVIQE